MYGVGAAVSMLLNGYLSTGEKYVACDKQISVIPVNAGVPHGSV